MDYFTAIFIVIPCVIFCGIFSIIMKYGRRRHLVEQASKFQGPPALPLIGNALMFTGSAEDILNKIIQLSTLYPTPFRLWLGNCLIFFIDTPQQLKVVLNSQKTIDKGELFDFARVWLGEGLLTASGRECIAQRKVLLDHLLELSRENGILSDEALREEVETIIVAGSDTTAVTSSYVMLMLAFHPEIQDKVYQELWEIYGEDDIEERDFTEDLACMTYLERVIKETLRLFPIVPLSTRSVINNLNIDERHTFPAGSLVLVNFINLHRNKDYWPDPLKFDPDRFLPVNVEDRHPYAYLPFSGGPRGCIGSKYAMISLKILLATILRRYVLKKDHIIPVKDCRFKWEFVMRPVDPITLRLERRT